MALGEQRLDGGGAGVERLRLERVGAEGLAKMPFSTPTSAVAWVTLGK